MKLKAVAGMLLAMGACMGVPDARAGRILIDFGHEKTQMPSPDAQGMYWNNLFPIAMQIDERIGVDLVATSGRPSGIRLEVAAPFQNAVGPIDVVSGGHYPKEALDRWVARQSVPGILRLRGLRPEQIYRVYIFATRSAGASAGEDTFSSYTVGTETKQLQTMNNRKERALFENVRCAADGTLDIRVARGMPGQGIICVMEIIFDVKGSGATPPSPQAGPTSQAVAAASPAAPAPQPGVVEEAEGGSMAMRAVMGGILLVLGLGVAGFVIWLNMKK